ncbi:transcription termination/antitermination protein NusG, partial [Corynebacterium striatum]
MSDENNVETPETSLEAALIGSVQEQAAEAVAESETATEEAYTEAEDQSAPAEEAASAEATEAAPAEDDDYRRRLRQFTRELKKQPGQWYIIQCYSGYENKVKTNLDM